MNKQYKSFFITLMLVIAVATNTYSLHGSAPAPTNNSSSRWTTWIIGGTAAIGLLATGFSFGWYCCKRSLTNNPPLSLSQQQKNPQNSQNKSSQTSLFSSILPNTPSKPNNPAFAYTPNPPLAVIPGLKEDSEEYKKYTVEGFVDACKKDELTYVKKMLEAKASVSEHDDHGNSLLSEAVKYAKLSTIFSELNPNHSSRANLPNKYGRKPMWNAVEHNNIAFVRHHNMQIASMEKNEADSEGNTPLHIAATRGHNDVIEYLCTTGPISLVKNHKGYSSYDILFAQGNKEGMRFYEEKAKLSDLADSLESCRKIQENAKKDKIRELQARPN